MIKYGGCCNCYPTCGRKLRFRKLISFENKARQKGLVDDDAHFGSFLVDNSRKFKSEVVINAKNRQSDPTN